ncbi:E3 ubiquitin-protein ligase RNF126 isoform X16 [Manis pentadactyla]|uniref:E3 ubiquitin-protein ligase RNF126 isoform X16 n=1 Tax=Manis pentadactyla TaxID=143292 RepID=UPI00255C9441|nr:E3 ubiquitin-protein ligase RNF126 isoform X16 [Manis pentadactyla]
MAEASPQPGRYFCHCCSVEIVPRLPDYICPRCESGFIEELPEASSRTIPPPALCPCRSTENGSAPSTAPADQSRQPFENVDQHLFTLPQGYGQFAFGIFDDSFEIPTFPTGAQAEEGRDPESRRDREQHPRHRYGARQPRARLSARRAAGRHEGVPTLEGIIQQLVNGIITPAAVPSLGLGPWSLCPGASCTQTRWTMPGGPTAWTPSSRSFSISLKTRAPRLQTRRKSRPSPPSLSPRSTWALGLSALCARTTMHWASMCGSCPATTSSTTAASCPGWSSTTAALSAEKASQDRTRPPTPRA